MKVPYHIKMKVQKDKDTIFPKSLTHSSKKNNSRIIGIDEKGNEVIIKEGNAQGQMFVNITEVVRYEK